MRDEYLQEAQSIVEDPNALINLVSRRSKQLKHGSKPLIESLEKLEPEDVTLREIIEGKRIVVVDDSIVRGNTQRAIVRMLREAGALEIHVRISSPPVKWPCYYGIDFASRAELIAAGLETEEIRRSIGADSLGYVSMEGLIAATTIAEDKLCTACFSGKYPIQIPADLSAGKNLLEVVNRYE